MEKNHFFTSAISYQSMKNIVITGFMGTGKTAVGSRLAAKLGVGFIDTDDLIEKEAGMSISQIFAQFGEAYFRELESKIIREVSSHADTVISTGGGAIVNPLNFEMLKKSGIVVCLTASIETILSRVGKGDERPLISADDKRETISRLLKVREPFYKKADFIIDTTEKSINAVVNEILKAVDSR